MERGVVGAISTVCIWACNKPSCTNPRNTKANKRATECIREKEICRLNRVMVTRLVLN